MRDFVLEHLGVIDQSQKRPYYQAWSAVPALVAACEIGNSSKHFVLRDRRTGQPQAPKTKAVGMKMSGFAEVYANEAGDLKVVSVVRPEVFVTLSDGQVLELYAFTAELLKYWKDFLAQHGLKVRRQPFSQLSGG